MAKQLHKYSSFRPGKVQIYRRASAYICFSTRRKGKNQRPCLKPSEVWSLAPLGEPRREEEPDAQLLSIFKYGVPFPLGYFPFFISS